MKILLLTPYVPYPPNSGGQTRTFNLVKQLSKKHEITSFSFLRHDHQEPNLDELKKYCKKIKIFRRSKSFASVKKILDTALSPYPYLVNMYLDSQMQQAIKEELDSEKYDLIHVETYYMVPNIPQTDVPLLLAEQTIEYLVYLHFARTSPWWKIWPPWFFKPLLYVDSYKHKYWEQYFWKKANKVVAMSEDDKIKMLDLVPKLDADVVANGVDVKFFEQKIKIPKRNCPRLLFVGNFNWLQNREAAQILISEIWPLIKKQLPSAKLWIVGREAPAEIVALASKDIEVSGNVEDIREAYQGVDLLIAPIFGGGGTRYKILEAMASHLPVVTTEIGIEGLGAVEGVHAGISNDKQKMVEEAVKIIKDKKYAAKLASNGFELVTKTYNWDKIGDTLERIYEETARKA